MCDGNTGRPCEAAAAGELVIGGSQGCHCRAVAVMGATQVERWVLNGWWCVKFESEKEGEAGVKPHHKQCLHSDS